MEPYRREIGREPTSRSKGNGFADLMKIMAIIQANRTVNFSRLELKSIIGRDESSDKVFVVADRLTGETYALKEFNRPYDSAEREEISREIQILKKLDHPNLVKCYEVFYVGDMIFLLFEPMYRGSLFGVNITSEVDLASLGHQVLSGLRYLHQNKIWHGDITPSNIFVNQKEQAKVLYSGKTLSKTAVVSTEIAGIRDGFSWDMWNVGLCMMKLSKGLNWSFRSEKVTASSQDDKALLLKPSMQLLGFVLSCMKGLTAEELLILHPFFEDLRKEEGKSSLSVAASSELSSAITHDERIYSSPAYEGEEQISPRKKKAKISTEDEDSVYFQGLDNVYFQDVDSVYDLLRSKYPSKGVPVPLPHLKRCIEHCNLFLPDREFEKEKLVMMWIAEDCIELQGLKRMEEIANSYFDTLVEEKIIMPSKFDNLYARMKYKINSSASFTWLLEQGNYVRIDAANSHEVQVYKEVLHLTWRCKTVDQTLFDALKNFSQLRTLVVLEDRTVLFKQLPNGILLGLKLLRTLDLSCTHVLELPGSIGLLESLRCLDVSETPIKRLPESMDRLHLLQSLILKRCFYLLALPRGFGRLINLRHLDLHIVGQLESMPRGMGNLIELQTLQAFLVGKDDGCGIGELKNMNEITGSFCISMLENVSSVEEAKKASLGDKKHIDKLELRWRHDHVNEGSQDTTEILECLQPHFQLKELQLTCYGGSKLPGWITNPSFTDLASITLYKCINCDILPSIGVLPSLKMLHILDMNALKDINTLFCRNHKLQGFNAFPKLEKLTLDNMVKLEEWTGIEYGDFPRLRHVSIRYCGKLCALPSFSHLYSLQHLEIIHCTQLNSLPEGLLPGTLESLIIEGCPKISARCLKDVGVDWFKIVSVKDIWIDFEKKSLD
ncbi:hypothetical protein ACS0TY_024715 [Phlomoides rotata]